MAGIQIVFKDTNTDTADYVDNQDHDPGNGVTTHKLRRTVHRTVEIGLVGHVFTACSGLFLIDQTGVQIGVDSHLFTRQSV